MSNDTSSPGFLTPTTAAVSQTAFEDALQAMVVGVTGLPAAMVRPRYQPKPPANPGKEVDWCAIGVTDTLASSSRMHHASAGDGHGEVVTEERATVLATFYGPGARSWAARLRDGLWLGQNRTGLRAAGITISEIGKPRFAPEMISGTWVPRVDLDLTVDWETRQSYGVLNIVDGPGELVTDTGLTRTITPKP